MILTNMKRYHIALSCLLLVCILLGLKIWSLVSSGTEYIRVYSCSLALDIWSTQIMHDNMVLKLKQKWYKSVGWHESVDSDLCSYWLLLYDLLKK